ncbi:hypothetical protein XCCB100_0489 [Xanthomonas campestris pv. campestris]|uniref:Uncharacterized protein n=1 Tax=Xanthomonas campestris pv. campestris (strain B100) TaxID=509169 RepID=B0RMY8_XANCB|nr:hypothetical protein XCCB100_0489 [Xanthomonas campestris pv. campestris]
MTYSPHVRPGISRFLGVYARPRRLLRGQLWNAPRQAMRASGFRLIRRIQGLVAVSFRDCSKACSSIPAVLARESQAYGRGCARNARRQMLRMAQQRTPDVGQMGSGSPALI